MAPCRDGAGVSPTPLGLSCAWDRAPPYERWVEAGFLMPGECVKLFLRMEKFRALSGAVWINSPFLTKAPESNLSENFVISFQQRNRHFQVSFPTAK